VEGLGLSLEGEDQSGKGTGIEVAVDHVGLNGAEGGAGLFSSCVFGASVELGLGKEVCKEGLGNYISQVHSVEDCSVGGDVNSLLSKFERNFIHLDGPFGVLGGVAEALSFVVLEGGTTEVLFVLSQGDEVGKSVL